MSAGRGASLRTIGFVVDATYPRLASLRRSSSLAALAGAAASAADGIGYSCSAARTGREMFADAARLRDSAGSAATSYTSILAAEIVFSLPSTAITCGCHP